MHSLHRTTGIAGKAPLPCLCFRSIRALSYLGTYKLRVGLVVAANIVLAVITIAEPILFGHIIDAISSKGDVTPMLLMWAGFGLFNTIAHVLVAREADRRPMAAAQQPLQGLRAHHLHAAVLAQPARHLERAARCCAPARRCSASGWNSCAHLATAVALVLLIPTAFAMDYRLSLVLVVLGALYVVIGKVVMNRTREARASVENHYHTVFSHVSDSISNVSVVRSYNRIEAETRE